jgi:hypothetical protein
LLVLFAGPGEVCEDGFLLAFDHRLLIHQGGGMACVISL